MKRYWKLIIFILSGLLVVVLWLTYGFGSDNEKNPQWPIGEETSGFTIDIGNTYVWLVIAIVGIFIAFLIRALRK